MKKKKEVKNGQKRTNTGNFSFIQTFKKFFHRIKKITKTGTKSY